MNILCEYRFPLAALTLKPGKVSGQSALCLVYADTRAYQEALDQLDVTWSTSVQAVSPTAVIVAVTINGITRSATGEDSDLMSAEARAFKRACSAFGLGRYLYEIDLGWQPYDGKQFGPAASVALDKALAHLMPARKLLTDNSGTASPQENPTVESQPEPWQSWQEPTDAYSWAVAEGLCNAEAHARNALRKLVREHFGGHMTTGNWREVCECFYYERLNRQHEKMAA